MKQRAKGRSGEKKGEGRERERQRATACMQTDEIQSWSRPLVAVEPRAQLLPEICRQSSCSAVAFFGAELDALLCSADWITQEIA